MTQVISTEYSYPKPWIWFDYSDKDTSPLAIYGKKYEEIEYRMKMLGIFFYGCRVFTEDLEWDSFHDVGFIFNFQGKII
jgi:hypothetical protein